MSRTIRISAPWRPLAVAVTAAALTLPVTSTFTPATYADDDSCEPGQIAHIPGPPPVFDQLGLTSAPDLPTGKGVTVAIVDSGVDGTQPQLSEALNPGASVSLVDDDEPDALVDIEGHGTAVAGVIAAQPSGDFGSQGVAPDAELLSIRVYRASDENSQKSGLGPTPGGIAMGIREAVGAGAEIIVVPLSDPTDEPALKEASLHAASRGSLVVASAGNRTTASDTRDTPRYPAAYQGVLSVTAVDAHGQATSASIHGPHLDIAAPGQNVLTTANLAGDCLYAPDAPSTSFATAYVAGVAALIAQAHPEEGPDGWAYRLMATADRPDPDSPNGHTGWGIMRPVEALRLRANVPPRGPLNPLIGKAAEPISQPHVHVTPVEPDAADRSPHLLFAVAAGGVLLILALGAVLRRPSPQRPQAPQTCPAGEGRDPEADEHDSAEPPLSSS